MKRLIVDKNDSVIGTKSRDEINFEKDIYRVASLWLTNLKGEVLIAQRGLMLNNGPGLYGPAVAGTVEEGETYESNIYKEAKEEIGLTNIKFAIGPKIFREGMRNYFCQFFTATINSELNEFILDEREVESVTWVSFKSLNQDVTLSPEKYVESMKKAIAAFSKK